MLIYQFDGSFDGLLTAIYEAYYRREEPDGIFRTYNKTGSLFAKYTYITTDTTKANKVYHSIIQKISYEALNYIYLTYLSELDESGTWIYNYLKLGWRIKDDINLYLTDKRVQIIHSTAKKVSKEKHLMLGLIRFKNVCSNLYYASIEPDYNIVGLIAPHFASRLSDQNWIIHDLSRNLAAVYNTHNWYVAEANIDHLNISYNNKEAAFQQLWKKYFDAINISNRANPRLQKSLMPIRYWKHLIEKQV